MWSHFIRESDRSDLTISQKYSHDAPKRSVIALRTVQYANMNNILYSLEKLIECKQIFIFNGAIFMSNSDIPIQPAILLTIIGESVLQDSIVRLLKSYDVTNYSISQVQGGVSNSGYNTNIEVKTLVSLETSDSILLTLKEDQGKHNLIAYRHNVDALY